MFKKILKKLRESERREREKKGLFQMVIEQGLLLLILAFLSRVILSYVHHKCISVTFASAFDLNKGFFIKLFLFCWIVYIFLSILLGSTKTKKEGLKDGE